MSEGRSPHDGDDAISQRRHSGCKWVAQEADMMDAVKILDEIIADVRRLQWMLVLNIGLMLIVLATLR